MSKNYTEAVAKAQKKYGHGLRQFKIALSKSKDAEVIKQLEEIPNLKQWIIFNISKVKSMKVKIVAIDGGKRLIKGKYADMLDLDYTQSLEQLEKDINLAMPVLLENLTMLDRIAANGEYLVFRGGHHIDIVKDGSGSQNWLRIEDHLDAITE